MFSFVHTDFYNYYLSKASLKGSKLDDKKILKMMIEEIKKISNNKLVIPTYNYDFPKTKRFNFKKDKSQVGTFSDYFWKKFSNFRTGVIAFGLHPLTKDGGAILNKNSSLIGILGDSNSSALARDWDYILK